ncbi:hypothetical protein ACRS6B_14150 [Nocardia asteroides]
MTAQAAAATAIGAFAADWQDRHGRQRTRLDDPRGFLAATGLRWPTATPRRLSERSANR